MVTKKTPSARKTKVAIDFVLGAVIIVLAFFDFIPRSIHAIIGWILLALLATHIWQHRAWFKALGRGKWNRKRIVKTVSVALVVLALLATIVLGFMIPDQLGANAGAGIGQGNGHGHGHYRVRRGDHIAPHHFLGYVTVAVAAFHIAMCNHFKGKRINKDQTKQR